MIVRRITVIKTIPKINTMMIIRRLNIESKNNNNNSGKYVYIYMCIYIYIYMYVHTTY